MLPFPSPSEGKGKGKGEGSIRDVSYLEMRSKLAPAKSGPKIGQSAHPNVFPTFVQILIEGVGKGREGKGIDGHIATLIRGPSIVLEEKDISPRRIVTIQEYFLKSGKFFASAELNMEFWPIYKVDGFWGWMLH